jgi:hypothetical protein
MDRNSEKSNIQRYPFYHDVRDVKNISNEEEIMLRQNSRGVFVPYNIEEPSGESMVEVLKPGTDISTHNTEMDNVQLSIISEFEENNFYSLWC